MKIIKRANGEWITQRHLVEDETELAEAEWPLERLGAARARGPLVASN